MRPQFFRNTGSGRFEELFGSQLGPFFDQKRLGRGLSRLDWNRDGLMDFAVSNMNERCSLVINTTSKPGRYVSVRLTATRSARDAIGSEVVVEAGDRTWRKQLVAGDGYMASNERLVQFGLGDFDSVKTLTVHWVSGAVSVVSNLNADGTVEFVEGASRAVLSRSPEDSTMIDVAVANDE